MGDIDTDCAGCRKLAQRIDSLGHAIKQLESEIESGKRMIGILEAEKLQWSHEKKVQESIIQQALNTSNATNNSYLEENNRLKEEIRLLKRRLAGDAVT
jgi:hypothetical protein